MINIVQMFSDLKPLMKYGFLVCLGLVLVLGLYLYDNARYTAGYNHGYSSAKLEAMERYTLEQSELKSRFEDQIRVLTSELEATRVKSTEDRDLAIELQKLVDTKPSTEVIREIKVIRDDCSNIPAYGRVLHTIIGQPPTIPNK